MTCFSRLGRWPSLTLTLAVAQLPACGPRQTITLERGPALRQERRVGEVVRIECHIASSPVVEPNSLDVPIQSTSYSQTYSTPIYSQVEVIHIEGYSPEPGELLTDLILLPLNILASRPPRRWRGYHSETKQHTSSLTTQGVESKAEIQRGSLEAASNQGVRLSVNGEPLPIEARTDAGGVARFPLKAIADAYLRDEAVSIGVRITAAGCEVGQRLDPHLLDESLQTAYGFRL